MRIWPGAQVDGFCLQILSGIQATRTHTSEASVKVQDLQDRSRTTRTTSRTTRTTPRTTSTTRRVVLVILFVVLVVLEVVLGVVLVVLGVVLVVLNIEQNIEHRTLFSEQ